MNQKIQWRDVAPHAYKAVGVVLMAGVLGVVHAQTRPLILPGRPASTAPQPAKPTPTPSVAIEPKPSIPPTDATAKPGVATEKHSLDDIVARQANEAKIQAKAEQIVADLKTKAAPAVLPKGRAIYYVAINTSRYGITLYDSPCTQTETVNELKQSLIDSGQLYPQRPVLRTAVGDVPAGRHLGCWYVDPRVEMVVVMLNNGDREEYPREIIERVSWTGPQ